MPLSEHEQRQFDAIERALYADDPKFANKLRLTDPRVAGKRLFLTSVAIVVAGIGVLIAGAIFMNWYVGLLGFLIMLAGASRAYAGFKRWVVPAQRADDEPIPFPRRRLFGRSRRAARVSGARLGRRMNVVELLEERWRRRMGGTDY